MQIQPIRRLRNRKGKAGRGLECIVSDCLQDVKPVISMKTAAGPGGLKKSPSPVQSPDGVESGWGARSDASAMGGSMLDSSTASALESSACALVASDSLDNPNPAPLPAKANKAGQLNFALRYTPCKSALQVTIVSATNLWGPGQQLLDPYVKLQLLPEKQHKVKTRVVRGTLEPVYDEEFTFYGLGGEQLKGTTLHFVVVAFDRYSRDEILGEVVCPLASVEALTASEGAASLSMELQSRSVKLGGSASRGELLTSLCYQPATNKLTVVLLKAKALPKFDITGLSDPYVKVYMLYNGQKIAKKKTHVKKRTLSPVYNESFVFELPSGDPAALEAVSLEFLVMDWDRVTKNEVMGRMIIGADAHTSSGRAHWDQVRRNPRRQFAEWHRLRP